MIKIIEKGTRHKIRCKDCGCLFSFDDEDIRAKITVHVGGFPGIAKGGKYINCPQCENEIVLDTDN